MRLCRLHADRCVPRFAAPLLALWTALLTGCVGIPHRRNVAAGHGVETTKPRLSSVQEHVTTRAELEKLIGHFRTDASYGRFLWARWEQVKVQIESLSIWGLGFDRFWKIVNLLAIFDENDRVAEYRVCSEWDLIECLRAMAESVPEPPPNALDPLPLETTMSRSTRREAYGRVLIADGRVYVEELEGGRFSLPVTDVSGVTLHTFSTPEELELKLHFTKLTAPRETATMTASPAQAARLIWLLRPANASTRRPEGARDAAASGSIVGKKPQLAAFREGTATRAELEEAAGQFKTAASYGRFFWARWQEADEPQSDRYWKIVNLLALFDDQDRAAQYRLCSERELPECLHAFAQSMSQPPGVEQPLAVFASDKLRRWQPSSRRKNQEFVGRVTIDGNSVLLTDVLGHANRVPAAAVDRLAAHDTYSTPETLQLKLHFSQGVEQRQTAPIGVSPEQAWRLVWMLRSAAASVFRPPAGGKLVQ